VMAWIVTFQVISHARDGCLEREYQTAEAGSLEQSALTGLAILIENWQQAGSSGEFSC
jgi:hypothetical protein